jgi:predicted phage terminase large subunit-like protein
LCHRRPDKFDRIVQSCDTANKASELSDFSVCTSWGIEGKDLYLLHVLRRRMEYPALKRAVREQCQAFAASVALIEDKASGTQLIQEMIQEGLHAVTRYQPQSDKIMLMHTQTAMIENGFVHLPKEAGWLAEYRHELSASPEASTTTRSTRPHRCSTGSSKPAAAPALTPGSDTCIKSSTKLSRPPRRTRGPNRCR